MHRCLVALGARLILRERGEIRLRIVASCRDARMSVRRLGGACDRRGSATRYHDKWHDRAKTAARAPYVRDKKANHPEVG